eukprot:61084-Heterocapsa_arctica.AAC.1
MFGDPSAHLLKVGPLVVNGLERVWASAEWVLRVDRLRDQGVLLDVQPSVLRRSYGPRDLCR